jgi:hypothetical protein
MQAHVLQKFVTVLNAVEDFGGFSELRNCGFFMIPRNEILDRDQGMKYFYEL